MISHIETEQEALPFIKPKLLLCDEPTGALDSGTSRDILVLLEKMNERYGTTMLIVTHNNSIPHFCGKEVIPKELLREFINKKIDEKIY